MNHKKIAYNCLVPFNRFNRSSFIFLSSATVMMHNQDIIANRFARIIINLDIIP